jgi:hypothetical protein
MSTVVQALPSLHAALLLVWTQPVAGAHESSVQPLPSLQLGAVPGLQPATASQVSTPLHALPSSQLMVA